MKKYTQADFDNFEVDEYGHKICPAGDYTAIKGFDAQCSFGERCIFGALCSFGERCDFGEQCIFGEGCGFDEGCAWCKAEYTIIDDEFAQPISQKMIKFCWHCGRKLEGNNE